VASGGLYASEVAVFLSTTMGCGPKIYMGSSIPSFRGRQFFYQKRLPIFRGGQVFEPIGSRLVRYPAQINGSDATEPPP
jgi:hypothetical protein